MPCNGDYMNPTAAERNSRKTCKHIVYLGKQTNQPVPKWVKEAAKDYYGAPSKLNEAVALLCQMCQKAPEDIIYNGRDPEARSLANWWDKHVEADRKREAAESKKIANSDLREAALAKLTAEERKALGF